MTRRSSAALTFAALAGGLLAGCSQPPAAFELDGRRYPSDGLTQWALPAALREVSGLTLDDQGRLFAHGDEAAVVHHVDYRQGLVVKTFAFGRPPVAGDFEGIAWAGREIWLVTSDGDLLAGTEGANGEHVAYRRHRTGFGRRCEIEGLEYDRRRALLLMPCKTARQPELRGRIAVLAWSPGAQAPAPDADLLVVWPADRGELNLSGLAQTPSGRLIAVAARQRALVELTTEGSLLAAFPIPAAERHRQMEGIAIGAAGELIIADEGAGKRGRLSVYAATR